MKEKVVKVNKDSCKELKKVFVYGSLKQGYYNHRLLKESTLLGECKTPESYTMYNLGAYPGIVPVGDTAITGEVYEVGADVFSRLDTLEGYPTFYNRKQIETEYGLTWVYYLNDVERFTGRQPIKNGTWEQ